ncbi:hypothetical protein [Roseivirga thermotolerans]|nr:hypothetical protein [Roseivirga thermotolerans]
MKYRIYIRTQLAKKYISTDKIEEVEIAASAYLYGKMEFTISGKKHYLSRLLEFRIAELDVTEDDFEKKLNLYSKPINALSKGRTPDFDALMKFPLGLREVTTEFIGHKEFGAMTTQEITNVGDEYIDKSRIEALKNTDITGFDLTKLVRLCEEINSNYKIGNYYSVGMLLRSLKDHIPPLFGFPNFKSVLAQYPFKSSSKKNIQNIEVSLKNISDRFLHETISKNETLPTKPEVEFKADIDVLLQEIIKLGKKK